MNRPCSGCQLFLSAYALFLLSCTLTLPVQAAETARHDAGSRMPDRGNPADLGDLRSGQARLEARFDGLEKRLDGLELSLNKRIDDLRADTNRQFEEQRGFLLWGFGILFAGMMSLIGFVLWDRRSALAPAIRRTDELAERQARVERALQELAAQDAKVAEILRHVGLR